MFFRQFKSYLDAFSYPFESKPVVDNNLVLEFLINLFDIE
jgi:hypothetical protein